MRMQQNGFTIVEVLVVIVVIVILAIITGISYTGIQNQANDKAVQTEVFNFGRKIKDYYYKNGTYPDSVPELTAISMARSNRAYAIDNWALQYCTSGTHFAIAGESRSGKAYFYSSKTGGVSERAGNRANDWCDDNYSIPDIYNAWTNQSDDWSTSRSSNGQ